MYLFGYILEVLFYYFIGFILRFTNVNGVKYITHHLVDNKTSSKFTYVCAFTINFCSRRKATFPMEKYLDDKPSKILVTKYSFMITPNLGNKCYNILLFIQLRLL